MEAGSLIIRSRQIVTPDGVRPGVIYIRDGRIVAVGPYRDVPSDPQLADFGDKMVLPGMVDTHVHINEPGRTEWEGFETATRAAAAGGYTTLVDMPLNSLPATTSVEALELKLAAARGKCWVDFGIWGGVVAENHDQVAALVAERVLGFKCFLVPAGIEGFSMVTREHLEAAMPILASAGLPLLVHAELPGPIEEARQALDRDPATDWRKFSAWLASRPDRAEIEAIRLMIDLCRQYRCPVHIVHLSTAKALDDLRAARAEGLPITVETCPHYLWFCAEGIPDGQTLLKCAPPIRSAPNQSQLWKALKEGVIDMVATDHSPCLPELKRLEAGDFRNAWGGISSLQLGVSVMWTAARLRGFSISDLVRWMSERPARLAGLAGKKGAIAAGCDADLVVFDPEASFQVEASALLHRHPLTAYMGESLVGVVETTFVRGRKVFDRGIFCSQPQGERCFRQ